MLTTYLNKVRDIYCSAKHILTKAIINFLNLGGSNMAISKLYTPLQIGTLTVKNRVTMAPMSTGYEDPNGTINDVTYEYWVERAKGGVGAIYVDAVTIDTDVPYQTPETISLGGDEFIPTFKRLTDKCHEYGCAIFPQIAYMGAECCNGWFKGIPAVGPSAYHNAAGFMCREMRLDEIPAIVKKYGEAARRARLAGCDGVQLHAAHAYMMLGAFLSPLRNKRTDRYGGSLANRARLAIEVIKEVKSAAGSDFPVIMRISPSERTHGGLNITDWYQLIPMFEEAGVDMFEVSGGNPYQAYENLIPCHYGRPAANLEEAMAIKAIATVPVTTVGKVNDIRLAEALVEQGKVDGVTMGRPLLADPELVNKGREGRYDDIAPCASCGGSCISRSKDDMHAHCHINPALGREKEWAIKPLEGEAKNVLVVGAGPAGLSAARVASLRGHKVTVLEKQGKVGGQLALASVPPSKQDLTKWVVYLLTQCEKQGVNFVYNVDATPELIKSYNPDVVILAVGANPLVINKIPGFDTLERVVTAQDVLAGKYTTPHGMDACLSGKVVMLGGGLVACETMEHICHVNYGSQTTRPRIEGIIVEMQPQVVGMLTPANRLPLLRSLESFGVDVRTGTKLMAFDGRTVIVEKDGVEERIENVDHVIWGMGSRPNISLTEPLKEMGLNVITIGDCDKIGTARTAIEAGYVVANSL